MKKNYLKKTILGIAFFIFCWNTFLLGNNELPSDRFENLILIPIEKNWEDTPPPPIEMTAGTTCNENQWGMVVKGIIDIALCDMTGVGDIGEEDITVTTNLCKMEELQIIREDNNKIIVSVSLNNKCLGRNAGKIIETEVAVKTKSGKVTKAKLRFGINNKNDRTSNGRAYIPSTNKLRADKIVTAAPNPFNTNLDVQFEILEQTNVSIKIYNTLGQLQATIADRQYEKGIYQINYNNFDLPKGYYILRYEDGTGVGKTLKVLRL